MNIKSIGMIASAVFALALFASAAVNNEPITKNNDTVIVNTAQICKTVRGFKGSTPLQIHIKKNKIVKVEALPNRETPQYFAKAKALLKQFEGKTVKKAAKLEVDGVSGATYSSKALVKNMKQGLEYYQNNK